MLIFNLLERDYFPSSFLFIIPGIIFCVLIFFYFKKVSLNKGELIFGVFFIVLNLISFVFGLNQDYESYVRNIELYQSGQFKTLKGEIEEINIEKGPSTQSISIDGVLLKSREGSSHSFNDSFVSTFKKGQIITVEYVNIENGIIKIYLSR